MVWYWLLALLLALAAWSAWTASRSALDKRDPRGALGWFLVSVFIPAVGPLLYWLLGRNRLQRHVHKRELRRHEEGPRSEQADGFGELDPWQATLAGTLTPLARDRALVSSNHVEILRNGEETYPAMEDAIDAAKASVSLMTYIFDRDKSGRTLVAALRRAHDRGVEVKVLVDGVGALYSFPSILRDLRGAGIEARRFLPLLRKPFFYFNMRNHRRVLCVDGRLAFTGGLNIRDGHDLRRQPKRPITDVHFRMEGPIVAQLQRTFEEDWIFSGGEPLSGPAWYPSLGAAGNVCARAITDGPDEELDVLPLTLIAAIQAAKKRVRIVTPYFLPDLELLYAMRVAVLRGVEMELLLPEASNLPVVQWAMLAQLKHVLEAGVKVWRSPPPFDHSKLMIVDDAWALVGSTNWDPRSLRLNFELNVELYERDVVQALHQLIDERQGRATRLSIETLLTLPLPARLRNAFARLAMPYL